MPQGRYFRSIFGTHIVRHLRFSDEQAPEGAGSTRGHGAWRRSSTTKSFFLKNTSLFVLEVKEQRKRLDSGRGMLKVKWRGTGA